MAAGSAVLGGGGTRVGSVGVVTTVVGACDTVLTGEAVLTGGVVGEVATVGSGGVTTADDVSPGSAAALQPTAATSTIAARTPISSRARMDFTVLGTGGVTGRAGPKAQNGRHRRRLRQSDRYPRRCPHRRTAAKDPQMTPPRRSTSQRAALQAVLAGTDEFATATDLHESLRASGARVGLATVYRTLADLVAAGEIDSLRGPAGETLYRRCVDSEHHHHLVCRVCGRTEEVTAPAVERWAKSVAKRFGFTEIGHEIELFGVCGSCASGVDGAVAASDGTIAASDGAGTGDAGGVSMADGADSTDGASRAAVTERTGRPDDGTRP